MLMVKVDTDVLYDASRRLDSLILGVADILDFMKKLRIDVESDYELYECLERLIQDGDALKILTEDYRWFLSYAAEAYEECSRFLTRLSMNQDMFRSG